jgi:hypothetical protein
MLGMMTMMGCFFGSSRNFGGIEKKLRPAAMRCEPCAMRFESIDPAAERTDLKPKAQSPGRTAVGRSCFISPTKPPHTPSWLKLRRGGTNCLKLKAQGPQPTAAGRSVLSHLTAFSRKSEKNP